MPSRKVLAASLGKVDLPVRVSENNTTVRFATAPPDLETARVQEDIRASVDRVLQDTPFKNGRMVEIDFSNGLTQEVPTDLGSPVSGFIICDIVAGSGTPVVYRRDEVVAQGVTFSRSRTHVKFTATAVCKVKLWVWA